jgi:type I protein arginine methyltransferase
MYSIHDYGDMTAERRRNEPYSAALRHRIAPGSVVLDIGAGAGILTLLACQAGARKVYAVEPDGIIEVARETVAANGFSDRVEFIQGLSNMVTLPERVDVIVSDLHGILPFFYGSLTSILDARDRFLKPGGFIIPERETVWAAVVSAPSAHRAIVEPWEANGGLDFAPARRRAVNSWRKWVAPPHALLVEPKAWSVLNYSTLTNANALGHVRWTIARSGIAHGLCMWFDCETAPGSGFSNSPGSAEVRLYHQAFFPWPRACQLELGDVADVEIRTDPVGGDYVWGWNTEIRGPGCPPAIKAQFRQSGFLAAPLSSDWLRKSGASFVPSPNVEANIDKMILDLLYTGTNLGEISRQLSGRFPERFPDWRNALTRVGEMSLRYSQ